MKRSHRRWHLWIWLLLAPAMAGIIYLAVTLRPAEPINDTLPSVLNEKTP